MVNVTVSVGAITTTGTLTDPPAARVILGLLRETERFTGGAIY